MKKQIHFIQKLAAVFLISFLAGCAGSKKAQNGNSDEIEVTKIWDQGPHNAFTDLIRFKDAFYCTFREGTTHVKGWMERPAC